MTADFYRDRLAPGGVVVDKVQLFVGGYDQVPRPSQRPRALNNHVAGHARCPVGDGDHRVCAIRDGLRHVARDGLLNQRTKVGVGRGAPCARLIAVADQLKR